MYDGINALYHVSGVKDNITALPCWEVLVNEQTAQRVDDCKTATIRGLNLAYKPSVNGGYNFIIKGSLHKWHNAGIDNTGLFTIENVMTAVHSLCSVFDVPADRVELHGLEIGVNITLSFPALRIIKNAVSYKGKAFTQIDKRNARLGLICSLNDYDVKLYDKATQTGTDCGHVLRFEVKASRMRFIKEYGFSTLADLADPGKAYATHKMLVGILDAIVWTDTAANLNTMTSREQKQWLHLSNPHSWQQVQKVKAYRQRQTMASLLARYAKFDTGKELKRLFWDTWESLFIDYMEAGKCKPFHHPVSVNEAGENVTFSQLEYSGKKLREIPLQNDNPITRNHDKEKDNINGAKNAQILGAKITSEIYRVCCSCGKDISRQRKNSRFCSERVYDKAAKACRNKDSNRRRDLKRIVAHAINLQHAIVVTYQIEGKTFTDSLPPADLELSRAWLDRITRIDLIPAI